MFLSMSSSTLWCFTSKVFLQNSPRQSPQADTHFKPLRKQEHKREPHVFFEVVLQLQRMKFSISAGAGSRSVFIGSKVSFVFLQPQFSGFKHSRSKVVHWAICKWTLNAWKYIALSEGGRFCGFKVKEVVTLSINFACLNVVRVSVCFPL